MDNIEEVEYDLINRYLNHQLDEEESEKIEQRLKNDVDFIAKVDFLRQFDLFFFPDDP